MQPHPSWRIYVGDDIAVSDAHDAPGAAASDKAKDSPSLNAEERMAHLLDSAFARRARHTLRSLPAKIRQQPSAAPSPVLRWLLVHGAGEEQKGVQVAGMTPGTTGQQGTAVPPAPPLIALGTPVPPSASTAAAAAATSALARRGVGPKDPLLKRLLKKQPKAPSSASAATSITPASSTSAATNTASEMAIGGASAHVPAASHWTQHPWSAMTSTSWKVFRQQLGITVELVAPTLPSAETSGPSAAQPGSLLKTLPPADTLPAIRCWEEAQLPLSLGRCITHAYALPTAVQAQCVPLALLPRPAPPASSADSASVTTSAATAAALGMDILAVAETGSGKTAAYLVPLLHHVLCRAPKLLGYPDRISLGPLSLVIVPTRELAEQVTASLLQLCGQSRAVSTGSNSEGGQVSQDSIRRWEVDELGVTNSTDSDSATSVAAALAARNHLSELRVVKVVGGESRDSQYAALARGAHCVVGTVGQLQTLLEDRLLSLGNAQFVVMDEADRMIDEQQEERLVSVLERCPQPRQTVMFTATLSAACAAVAKRYLAKPGYYVVRTPYRCASIRQSFELVADTGAPAMDAANDVPTTAAVDARSQKASRRHGHAENGKQQQQQQQQRQRHLNPMIHAQKFARLVTWLVYGTAPIIIFANEKSTCDALWEELRAEAEYLYAQQEYYTIEDIVGAPPDGLFFQEDVMGAQTAASPTKSSASVRHTHPTLANLTSVAAVHSELSQSERRSLVSQFQRRQRCVLLTTDLLARGLDVAGVTLVINYDVPWSASASPSDAVTQYIHRIGRTGRAGSTGVAVTFVTLRVAMVQRAEELAAREEEAAPKQTEGHGKLRNAAARVEGDENDHLAALGELFDGDTRNVWMAGAASSASTAADGTNGRRRRRGDDDDDSDDVEPDDSDKSAEDGDEDTTGVTNHGGNGSRKPSRKRRKRSAPTFASDAAVLRPLWSFLVECAEGEGCRDGAAALRRGTYAKISIPPALGCIMSQLSATSQYGRITL
ncbi:hypothetical protein JKF63_07386 [Porcisia hertigi]|uniref:RNA helicase n=1 Tax=Porcisia hertigi TaxID=2761500 RepID=A0A836LKU3_9TRYP|nr:hypothetical protein JKF63_07386 [Porcisia hertigi]